MAGRIPQSFIDDLLARTDIVELIDSRVRLKKAGKNYQACCPFHNEKSPSFSVSPEKQFYHCFGCGAHGTAVGFLMEYDGLEFPDAIEELANLQGMQVIRETNGTYSSQSRPASEVSKKQGTEFLEQITKYYQHALSQSDAAKHYLSHRGLTHATIKDFEIGFAPDAWDHLLKRFSTSRVLLAATGMSIKNDQGREYDRFRNRLMFPIRNLTGQVIGFGGRVLDDSKPKYLNSPETFLFDKGKELYGLYQAKRKNPRLSRLLVVEGYMDVVGLAEHGIDYAVAPLGTSTTDSQILYRLFRQAQNVVCCYDGDNAGRAAAWRALDNALPHLQDGRELKFVFLPDGEDPDSLVRQIGKDDFETLLEQAQPFAEFMFERLERDAALSGEAGKFEVANKAAELIRRVPEGFTREGLITRLSRMMRWGENKQRIDELFARHSQPKADTPRLQKGKLTPLRRALALMVQYPALAAELPVMPELAGLKVAGIPFLLKLHSQICKWPEVTTAILLEHWRGTKEGEILAQLAMHDLYEGIETEEGAVQQELEDTFVGFINLFLKQRIEELQGKVGQEGLTPEETRELLLLLKEVSLEKRSDNGA